MVSSLQEEKVSRAEETEAAKRRASVAGKALEDAENEKEGRERYATLRCLYLILSALTRSRLLYPTWLG